MPKRRHQTCLCEQSHSFLFFKVENHGAIVARINEAIHHAVITGRGGDHDTCVAADDEWFTGDVHAHTVTTGCHTETMCAPSVSMSNTFT